MDSNRTPDYAAKQRCLEHYARLPEPQAFIQYDGFTNALRDSIVHPDEDGDALFAGTTYELMTGSVGVRVLMPERTTTLEAVRVLRKIANWIERDGILQASALTEELPW